MTEAALYGGLFLSALASATLIPGQSEAVLASLLFAGHSPWLLLAVASAGNILGSVINWVLGRGIERYRERRWFPVNPLLLDRAQRWYAKFGRWSLLLSWAPVIGDPLTIVAGVMREPFPTFLLLVAVAKIGRYVLLTVALLKLMG
ncbi:MAG TPA: YqaA family protein [Steroidobacteraceae bacterium]|nr:YqaA family protein [Steroidobacteraceae bacterium]